jgi:hypothetical protein
MKKILIFIFSLVLINCKSVEKKVMPNKFKFQTQYSQFYIEDKEAKNTSNNDINWTDEDFDARLATISNQLVVFTTCYGYVKGEISILKKPKRNFSLAKYDHVVEHSIEINSGIIQLIECPTNFVEFEKKVQPGRYRVRVYFLNLDSVIDPDIEASDYYKIEMWLDNDIERKILKKYIPAAE